LSGLFYSLIETVCIGPALTGLSYLLTWRGFRRRYHEGAAFESGFGPDFVEFRVPWSQSRLRFRGMTRVAVRGSWVLIQMQGSRLVRVCPIELFPPEQLSKLAEHHVGRMPAGA
jgi:hypothetical protein